MSRRTDARPITTTSRLASWIGSALEYYDFAVYGTAAAAIVLSASFLRGHRRHRHPQSMVVVGVAVVRRVLRRYDRRPPR